MKLPHRRQFLHLVAGAAALPAVSRITWAQAYPARSVRVVVGFAPGGAPDILARLIAAWLSERLGQEFIVENRLGGGSNIGTEAVVRAPADGYTLLLVSTTNTINATLYDRLNFDFLRDIAPVASITRVHDVMVANLSVPSTTVPEFIAYAKANPGKLTMASGGVGTPSHLEGELFKTMIGVDVACATSGHSSRTHRSSRLAGAGHVHQHALGDRIHQGWQAARTCSHHRDALRSVAGHPDRG